MSANQPTVLQGRKTWVFRSPNLSHVEVPVEAVSLEQALYRAQKTDRTLTKTDLVRVTQGKVGEQRDGRRNQEQTHTTLVPPRDGRKNVGTGHNRTVVAEAPRNPGRDGRKNVERRPDKASLNVPRDGRRNE